MKSSMRKGGSIHTEYRLLITQQYSERLKMIVSMVALRTVEEFSNFRYEIVVEDSVMSNVLRLDIHGLRTPKQTLPSFGPAEFRKEFPDLKSVQEVIVSKLDGEENVFQVKITKNDVEVLKSPKEHFVELVTNEEVW